MHSSLKPRTSPGLVIASFLFCENKVNLCGQEPGSCGRGKSDSGLRGHELECQHRIRDGLNFA